MKSILTILSLFLVNLAFGQIGLNHTEVLKCEVVSIEGRFNSFLPPEVGDTITFDLSKETQILNFDPKDGQGFGNYIPHSDLQKEKHPSEWRSHQAFYIIDPDPTFGDATKLIIGAYGNLNDPLTERNWEALIQQRSNDRLPAWRMEQARLSCKLISP